jgi:sphingosine kinase
MVRAIRVNKDEHNVIVSFDDEGFRIDGDPTAAKACNFMHSLSLLLLTDFFFIAREDKTVCCCVPISAGTGPDPTILPIDNLYVLNSKYVDRNRTLYIDCILPEDRSKAQSPANVYSFAYTVSKDLEEDAQSFCKELKEQAYKDMTYGKRLLVLINPNAGHKNARKIYCDEVRPIFELAECKIEEISEL